MNARLLTILNSVALMAVLTVNALANILPINGLNTGQVSDFYPNLFTPAGFTFSIWSIIYLLLIIFVIYQFRIRNQPFFAELSLWFLLSCIANISWILAWHHLLIWASLAIMIVLLFSLIRIFLLLQPYRLTWPEKFWVKLPFTFYFSWICVATIANVSALLVSIGWEGSFLTPAVWAIVMCIVATLLAIFIAIRFQEPAFLVVLMWALFGIYSKHMNTTNQQIATIALMEIIILALVFSQMSVRFFRERKI